jgi:hypothetical protein
MILSIVIILIILISTTGYVLYSSKAPDIQTSIELNKIPQSQVSTNQEIDKITNAIKLKQDQRLQDERLKQQLENERLENERLENERLENERLEGERLKQQQLQISQSVEQTNQTQLDEYNKQVALNAQIEEEQRLKREEYENRVEAILTTSGWKESCATSCSTNIPKDGFVDFCNTRCDKLSCPDCAFNGPWVEEQIKLPSGKKEYCSAYCSSNVATPGFESQCEANCTDATCQDCIYKGPYDKAVILDFTTTVITPVNLNVKLPSGKKEYCGAYCSSNVVTPGFESQCEANCTDATCHDCIYKGPYDKAILPTTTIPVINSNIRIPSGKKEYCSAYCSSKVATPGFESQCSVQCIENTCWDCPYKGPYEKAVVVQTKSPSVWKEFCSSKCGNKVSAEGYGDVCAAYCTDTQCWDCAYKGPWNVPSGMKDYCSTYCPTKYPGDTNVYNCNLYCTNTNGTCWDCGYKGPYARTPSGNSGTCATYCNSATITPGYDDICASKCTESSCWDCNYKGPYNKSPSGRAETCAAYCGNKTALSGYEDYCKSKCTDTQCWDCTYKGPWNVPSEMKDYCSTHCPTKYPGDTNVYNCNLYCTNTNGTCWDCAYKGPYARTPSGNSSTCATYCNSATITPGFDDYCPTYCTETPCWDCNYKGPYNKPPSGRATICAAYCSNRDVTPGYEGYCTEKCTETPCWDCAYKGPYGKPPSGWTDYCSTYCSTSTPPSYAKCPSYCTNANCWDCGYKGPYM